MKVKCANCKEYIEKSNAIPRGISNFCGMDCVFSKANKGKSGGGYAAKTPKRSKIQRDNLGYQRLVSDQLREIIFKKDNYSCRLCGQANNLAVHHIIYRSNIKNKPWENETSNLITLCNHPCHLSIVHGNKKRFQKLCLGVVWLREIEGDKYTTIYELEKRLENDA